MIIFKLPDLGEGLPDAIIREWYVKEGDEVKVDQPLVAMETAKALVDVPSPYNGTIEKLHGDAGDTINTGEPLISFAGETADAVKHDTGTVVGAIEESGGVIEEIARVSKTQTYHANVKAIPAVRQLAKKMGVDLHALEGSGADGAITMDDVLAQTQAAAPTNKVAPVPEGMTQLAGVKRAMVMSMAQSHREVVPVTVVDDADIQAWPAGTDVTVRLLRAMQIAIEKEPMLNVTFNGNAMAYKHNDVINIGMAVDTPHGLYVPVLKDIAAQTDAELRENINRLKQQARDKAIPQDDLKGATIMLSNFGALAGRYANPIIVPPMVAILGVGRSRDEVVAREGKTAIHRIMPLSITVDHRAVTGGEAVRFLAAVIAALE